ncbi:MAG: UvrD-helicase domain-containing protein, partial [Anaerolinea sp.]|nr:UvrD-helicase domain-containing protein [Anaerolinea sp.]
MVFNATRAQGLAINTHDRNLIVMAGAGSGKTRVLVERYLKLLHEHPDWSLNALVAITFTQKAAQEMRDRVRQAVQTALANAADAESQRVWAGRMSALGSARIDTIHALCASILRANAAEANVDPGFEVLDETEAAILLDDAVDDVLRLLPTDDSAALALFREYDSTAIRKALKAFAGGEIAALVPPDSDPTPNSRRGESTPLMQRWHAAWADNARTAITRLLRQPEYQAGWQPAAVMPTGADKLFDVWLNCAAHLTALR